MMLVLYLLSVTIVNLVKEALGHAYMSWPASRNFDDCSNFEPQSVNNHCNNCNTESCGTYRNINYAHVVHPPTGTFTAGGVLEVETIVTAHHKGYMELRICTRPGDLTQDCFDEHLLSRDTQSAALDPAPVDESHPGRWYIPPPAVDWSPDAISVPSANVCSRSKAGTRYRWAVRLPSDLECEHCVVQFFWVTANSCNPAGLPEYFSKGSTQTWITSQTGGDASGWWKPLLSSCPSAVVDPRTNNNGAEKFWNCADIKVTSTIASTTSLELASTTTSTSTLKSSFAPSSTTETSQLRSTSTLTSSFTASSTTKTSHGTRCMDAPLPIEWTGGGVYTCATYSQNLGTEYCAHAALDAACCFCGGGRVVPEPEPEPEPEPTSSTTTLLCRDAQLPAAWSSGGVHTCSTYSGHGGSAYCAHAALLAACCFCGGGLFI
mmetsp:Transcript_62963/g.109705  ORF Transcript_62963/g.109705 Transcript_62963/m.109705 type:complete len:434 (-) Transcript_62963:359-1660(-)